MIREIALAGGLVAVMAGGIAVTTPAATAPKPTITGCGTTAIAKTDLNNAAALRAKAECFAAAEAIAAAAKNARLNRLGAIVPPPASGRDQVKTALNRSFSLAATNAARRFNASEIGDMRACWIADQAALNAVSALGGPFVTDDFDARVAAAKAAVVKYEACG